MNPTNGWTAPVATIATSYLVKLLNLDTMMYGIVFALIQQMLAEYGNTSSIDWFKICLIFIPVAIIFVIYKYRKIFFRNRKRKEDIEYFELNIYYNSEIKTVLDYMDHFPNFYSKPTQIDYGNATYIAMMMNDIQKKADMYMDEIANRHVPANGTKIIFNDENFKTNGFIIFQTKSVPVKTDNNSVNIDVPYVTLCIDKKTTNDANKYFKQISKKNDELAKKNILTLYHLKAIKTNGKIVNDCKVTYKGPVISFEMFERQYMDTFFHPHKQKLWNLLKQIHFHPEEFKKLGQAPRCGLLLHGPPGTGKSTFAYRLAMCLKRHIVSLDLRSIKSKSEVFRMIRNPSFYLDGGLNSKTESKDVVFILDEFDLTVAELFYRDNTMKSIIQNWRKTVSDLPSVIAEKQKNKDETTTATKKDEISVVSYGYDDENINLGDLLELFNGPVPNDGMIVIATTNKFDEIKEMCPALFRHGRLTPVFFGYACAQTIQEISEFYFKNRIEIPDNYEPKISTSQILEIVTESKLDKEKGFDYFRSSMVNLLRSNIS